MSEKKLFQVDWSRGQTDGDPSQGTVRRILNMDLDDNSRLVTRRALTVNSSPMTSLSTRQAAYLDYTPGWLPDVDGWLAVLHERGVIMMPMVGGFVRSADNEVVSFPGVTFDTDTVDLSASQLVVYGDKVLVSLVTVELGNVGVFMITSPDVSGRFRAPLCLVGTQYELSQSLQDDGWTCSKVEMERPELYCEPVVGYGFCDTAYNAVGTWNSGFRYHWPTARIPIASRLETGRSNLLANMSTAGSKAVGLIAMMTSANEDMDQAYIPDPSYVSANPGLLGNRSDWGEQGQFGRNPVIEYKVQYLYYGGQMSRLSTAKTVSFADGFTITDVDDEIKSYSIGFTVVVGRDIDKAVRGINVYRKIVDSGNELVPADDEFYLIGTAWLDSDTLSSLDSSMGQTNIDYKMPYRLCDRWSRGHREGDVKFDIVNPVNGWTRKVVGGYVYWDTSQDSIIEPSLRSVKCDNGSTNKSSGWAVISSQHMIYVPEHYGASCDFAYSEKGWTFNLAGNTGSTYTVRVKFAATIMSIIHGVSGLLPNTVIRFGADMPLVATYISSIVGGQTIYTPVRWTHAASYADGGAYPYQWRFERAQSCLPTDMVSLVSINGTPSTAGSTAPATVGSVSVVGSWAGSKLPFVGVVDRGDTKQDSESSVVGGRDDDFVSVKPLAISVSGGRLMGIGGLFDGDPMPSRFWYSLFQNYGMVLEGNYLDYGARDDGRGVAISASRGRVLIHFSSATYVVDVSGGSDMAWRELGAFSGIGLLNRNCVVETPAGSVWCDANGVYIFNNRGLVEISHRPEDGVSVRETYLELISVWPERARVVYKQDKKQVWICVGKHCLVWDILTGAWHENELDDLSRVIGDFDVIGFFSTGGNQRILVTTSENKIYMGYPAVDGHFGAYTFDWGVDVSFTAGAPELVKKAKRFYIDTMSRTEGCQITVSVNGQGGAPIVQHLAVAQVSDIIDPDKDTMVRFSASARGRAIEMSVRNRSGTRWPGVVESLGMSHKFKALK